MSSVSDHHGELDTQGAHGGLPIFWRSAPAPDGVDAAPVLYLHGVPTNSDDWISARASSGSGRGKRWWRPRRDSDD